MEQNLCKSNTEMEFLLEMHWELLQLCNKDK